MLIHSAGHEGRSSLRSVCREGTGEPVLILFGFSVTHEMLQYSTIPVFPNWSEADLSGCPKIKASVTAESWTFRNNFATSQFWVSVLD